MANKNFQVRHGLTVNNTILVTNGQNIGVNTATPQYSLHINTTDALLVPIGNTSQRPVSANGLFRYNTETNTFEGYANGQWGPIAGAGGAYFKGNEGPVGDASAANNIFRVNANTVSNNITFIAGENASAAGPITVASGFSLVIQPGARVVIS